jgi:hypothetical protein
MDDASRRENEHFENEVRRIARELWPSAEFSGSTVVDGRERDGIFETEDCIHIVEATTSRRKEKAKEDIAKLKTLLEKRRRSSGTRAVRGWWIARDEPTADQRQIANKHRDSINALSFSQFQARLIDSRAYLSARDNYVFGSVRDPGTGKPEPAIDYVPLDLLKAGSNELVSPAGMVKLLNEGCRLVLLGDYGAGKSMTLRKIYGDLKSSHLKSATSKFPAYLNLRDHHGQSDPAEVIERHARSIGFCRASDLVRAWRAGYVHLLIDGFDEISTVNIQGLWKKLQDNRFRAMEAVRRLIREHPAGAGLMVAGRAHFFDSSLERQRALGLPANSIELSLNEFTEGQISTYLKRAGITGFVPGWLPSRPLLVGYLAARGLLVDLVKEDSTGEQLDPAMGWDHLLDSIAAREAEIEAGIDGGTVRRILERLATKARATPSGLGPIGPESVVQGFSEICGYGPDDRGMVLLQRLPGLGIDREEDNSRSFVDQDFADACRAGDLVSFVDNPFDFDPAPLADIESAAGPLTISVASLKARARGFSEGKINAALGEAGRTGVQYLAADLVRLLMERGFALREPIRLHGLLIPDLEIGPRGGDFSSLEFCECFFSHIELDQEVDAAKLPVFRGCFVDELDGRVSRADLPTHKFDEECIIENFIEAAETTAAVLGLALPLGTRVCLTVLKKLYERRGSGRKESALHRGLDHSARRLVSDVLRVLESEGLASPYKRTGATIWLPDRSSRRRVGRMVSAPTSSEDPVLRACSNLGS